MILQKNKTLEQLRRAISLHQAGRLHEAARIYRGLLSAEPAHADVNHLLGIVEHQLGNNNAAAELISRAIQLNPHDASYYNNMSIVCKEQGRIKEAVTHCRKALAINPDNFETHVNLGNYLKALGQQRNAVASYKRAIALKKDNAEVFNNLGSALTDLGHLAAAADACCKALALKPDFSEALNTLGKVMLTQGRLAEAIAHFRKALVSNPLFSAAQSNLLYALNFANSFSQEEIYNESLQWGDKLLRSNAAPAPGGFANIPDKGRCLRVGYVSPDFRAHSVAYFIEPVIRAHNRKSVEIFCYAKVTKPDEVSERIRRAADHWHSILGMDHAAFAAQIREDGIDILVDLAGHTGDNSLPVFARRPAPVQVSWLGYANTTGLWTIDYRLTDSVADPAGEADRLHSESLVRLQHGFLCYQPETSAPEVGPLPCLERGYITFGSFNNLTKCGPKVIKTWAEILKAVPGSRLLLKAKQLGDNDTRERYLKMFSAAGVPAERIQMQAKVPKKEDHLNFYNRVDIGLDPFPYNGTTTSCEALWMGVPVVTLLGNRHAGRVGASIMHQVGLENLVVKSAEEYVRAAQALADDRESLQEMRGILRSFMQESPLMDSGSFVKDLEDAYRRMWHTWCRNK